MRLDAMRKYARAFKVDFRWLATGVTENGNDSRDDGVFELTTVPVVGKASAGVWLEIEGLAYDDSELIPAVPYPAYPYAKQVAFKVEGPSMNKVLPDGCYAVGMTIETSRAPRHNDIVAVHRVRGGLLERTIKRFRSENGAAQLFPESTDPRFQSAIVLESHEEDIEVSIIAIIIGMYQPL
jgi:SOS-response transcriptional repressor LexA